MPLSSQRLPRMFTQVDKNLLIAALESALLYARNSAGVSSLDDLTAQIAALRTAFDANPDNVTDAQLDAMIATLQALEIPDPATLSRLLTTTTVNSSTSYLAVCSWATVLNKPATFPPAEHAHAWSEISFRPATFPPATHTHEAQAVAWSDVMDKPATFPPAEHTHTDAMADWNTLQNKPATFPPEAHTHPEYVGGSVIADASPTWKLRTGGFWTPSFPFAAEGFERVWVGWKGSIVPDSGAAITLYQDGGDEAYEWFRFLCTPTRIFQVVAAGGQYAQTTLDSDAFDMLAEITPTAVNVTVNGATISCPHSAAIVGTESINFSVEGQVFEHLIYWPGDRACVAPRVAYNAAQIDNNILINQAARHIGTGQYDLTLDAPAVLYQ